MATIKEAYERSNYTVTSKLVRRTRSLISPENILALEKNLDELPKIFGNTRWVLTGGIATQIACKEWYRNPGNINVSVHEDALFEIAQHAHEKANYRLLSRGWQIRPYPGIKRETYEVPNWNMQELSRNYPNLRLIRFDGKNPSPNKEFLDFIDVHLYRIAQHRYDIFPQFNCDEIVSLDGNKAAPIIPFTVAEKNIQYVTNSNKIIQVRGLEYLHHIKYWLVMRDQNQKRREREIDYFDLTKLKQAKKISEKQQLTQIDSALKT